MKIAFLLHSAYGIGGTIRTTFNLAEALADRHHDVEIVSMMRHREDPPFALDARVRVVPLVDTRSERGDVRDLRYGQPARVFPAAEKRYRDYNRLIEARAEDYLRHTDADVLIGTRPGLNVYLARFGPRRALRIGQEHLSHDIHSRLLRAELQPHYRRLDALTTMTVADACVYGRRMPLPGVHVCALPGSVPEPSGPQSDGTAPVVAAVGRLSPGKRFDVLIAAFSQVAARHPDWRLRIYGIGPERDRLIQCVTAFRLEDQVQLMGARTPIEPEISKAAILAVPSSAESFGMIIVEAMRCGVPVVSTDCPLGPAEIIHDGVDGRLVPVDDPDALAAALIDLIEDEPARRRMAATALQSAARFDPDAVAHQYEELFARLELTRAARARARLHAGARTRLRGLTGRTRLINLLRRVRWVVGVVRLVRRVPAARAARSRPSPS